MAQHHFNSFFPRPNADPMVLLVPPDSSVWGSRPLHRQPSIAGKVLELFAKASDTDDLT